MDNTARSERTRKLVMDAALEILVRDGPARLTLDAIAREAGISKGGLMHQFRTKSSVIKALLVKQIEYFEQFSQAYIAEHRATSSEPELASQIAVAREAVMNPQQPAVVFAILGVLGEEPELMQMFQDIDCRRSDAIQAEAKDPDMAMLRWFAAQGMHLTSIFGIGVIDDAQRQRLFEMLADSSQWCRKSQ